MAMTSSSCWSSTARASLGVSAPLAALVQASIKPPARNTYTYIHGHTHRHMQMQTHTHAGAFLVDIVQTLATVQKRLTHAGMHMQGGAGRHTGFWAVNVQYVGLTVALTMWCHNKAQRACVPRRLDMPEPCYPDSLICRNDSPAIFGTAKVESDPISRKNVATDSVQASGRASLNSRHMLDVCGAVGMPCSRSSTSSAARCGEALLLPARPSRRGLLSSLRLEDGFDGDQVRTIAMRVQPSNVIIRSDQIRCGRVKLGGCGKAVKCVIGHNSFL